MTNNAYIEGQPRRGDFVVRQPRRTDVMGHTLRGIFGDLPMPADMLVLLKRLERVSH
ncbi:hypothetical protein [Sphingomonas sp. GC_Shp_4]|jgi:hypothetical protein|uniref:hypothetical protein n=1 Tax=Sphingomonas sp. GC_Shp_4 TaxID=2937382 RepID=UPI00226B9138|nr:hypothetical protein [Sphingomonas sp. GC_Shp_4]